MWEPLCRDNELSHLFFYTLGGSPGNTMTGDQTVAKRFEPTLPGVVSRVNRVVGAFWSSSAPTVTHRENYQVAADIFEQLLDRFRSFETEFRTFQVELEASGVPWTPGRGLPEWSPD